MHCLRNWAISFNLSNIKKINCKPPVFFNSPTAKEASFFFKNVRADKVMLCVHRTINLFFNMTGQLIRINKG